MDGWKEKDNEIRLMQAWNHYDGNATPIFVPTVNMNSTTIFGQERYSDV